MAGKLPSITVSFHESPGAATWQHRQRQHQQRQQQGQQQGQRQRGQRQHNAKNTQNANDAANTPITQIKTTVEQHPIMNNETSQTSSKANEGKGVVKVMQRQNYSDDGRMHDAAKY